jgi:hypothetical protein
LAVLSAKAAQVDRLRHAALDAAETAGPMTPVSRWRRPSLRSWRSCRISTVGGTCA